MPLIVVIPDATTEVNRIRTAIAAAVPDWANLDGDVIVYATEQQVADRIRAYNLLNSSGRALIVATAQGDDLDDLLGNFDLTRLPGESDAAFRARLPSAFSATSGNTADYVRTQALAVTGVVDAQLDRETATGRNATVYIQATGFTAPDAALRTTAQNYLNDESRKPWDKLFTVADASASRYAYTLTAVGPDNGIIYNPSFDLAALQTAVDAALDAALLRAQRYNRAVRPSEFVQAALGVDGILAANFAFAGAAISQSWTIGSVTTSNSATRLNARDRNVYIGTRGANADEGSTVANRIEWQPDV